MTVFTFGLTVVRHGETQFNKDGILQGQAIDSPLSETGLQQADSVGRYLKDVHFSNVFVSDMQRARQTAEAIVKHNASCTGLQIVTDPALKERSFGVAEGRPVQDIRDMAQAAGQTCPDFTPPQGETPQQVKERVILFLDHLLQRMCADHRWPDDDPSSSSDGVDEQQTEVAEQAEGKACDGVRTLPTHALVVSHGAYVRVMLHHLVEELHCSPPGGSESERAHMFSLCPNTGVCRFVLSLTRRQEGDDSGGPAAAGVQVSAVRCVFVHRADHLKNE